MMVSVGSLGAIAGGNSQASLNVSIRLIDQLSGGLLIAQNNVSAFEQVLAQKLGVSTARSIGLVSESMLSAGKAGLIMTAGLVAIAKETAEFDKVMAQIAAVLGETTVTAIAAVRQQAIELSKDFSISATEIARGQLLIAQAGGTVNEVLTATPSILNLATATTESFDLAAKSVIKTLNAYGQSIGNLSDTTRIVNDLQFAVNRSVNTLQTLNDSIKVAAPFTATLGIGLEDLTSALMITSNAGLEAGIAGRSLGQALQQLARTGMRGASVEAKKLSTELAGIINQHGTLGDVVQKLEQRYGTLTDAESSQIKFISEMTDAQIKAVESGNSLMTTTGRIGELVQVFGARGARVFADLLGHSAEMKDFKAQMELQVVTAADEAKVAMDNLASQSRIALNKIQAGILESNFGKLFKDQIDQLNSSGQIEDFGKKLGEGLASLASEILPAVITGVKSLIDLVESAGPAIGAAATTISTLFETLASIINALPSGVTQVITSFLVLDKIFNLGLVSMLKMELGLAAVNPVVAALNANTQALTSSTFILGSATDTTAMRMRTDWELVQAGIDKTTLSQKEYNVALQQTIVEQKEYEAYLRDPNRGGIMGGIQGAASSGAGKVIGGLSALFAVQSLINSSEQKQRSGGDIFGDALGTGLQAGLAATLLSGGNPLIGLGVGLGGAVITGIIEAFTSQNSKSEIHASILDLAEKLKDPAIADKFKDIGNDTGKQIVAGINLAMQGGIENLSKNFANILKNEDIALLGQMQLDTGGRAQHNPDGSWSVQTSPIGKEDLNKSGFWEYTGSAVAGGLNWANLGIPGFLSDLIQQKSLGSTNKDLMANVNGTNAPTLVLDDKIREELGIQTPNEKGNEGAISSEVLNKITSVYIPEISKAANEAADAQERKRKQIEEDAKLHGNTFDKEAAQQGFKPLDGRAIIETIAQQTLPESLKSLTQLIVNQITGSGVALESLSVQRDKTGNLVMGAQAKDQQSSRLTSLDSMLKELTDTEKNNNKEFLEQIVKANPILSGYTGFDNTAETQKLGAKQTVAAFSDQEFNATLDELAKRSANLGFEMEQVEISLTDNVQAYAKLNDNITKLSKSYADAGLSATKSQVSGTAGLAGFITTNADALGISGAKLVAAQEQLARTKALQAIESLIDLQLQEKNDVLNVAIEKQKLENQQLGLAEAKANVEADYQLLALKVAEAKIHKAELELMLEDARSKGGINAATIQATQTALDNLNDFITKFDQVNGSADSFKALLDKVTAGADKINDLINVQISNIDDANQTLKEIAAALGINLNDLTSVQKATLLAWAKQLVLAQESARLQANINNMLQGADPLGKALEQARMGFNAMGFSAVAIDDALRSFQRVQFLNAVIGFVNNFKQLAASSGRDLNLGATVLALQNQLLDAGSNFLDQLLSIADPQTFSEMLAKQNFLTQNVNKNTVINLQADLIFPAGISADQQELISKIALAAITDAINKNPLIV